ncbi:MAG: hypothetical protein A2Y20_09965 [Firmicutes bacterium GWF2_51_9]|nr:MAG: hypothetical protein A2Y20_09965 [Firmicutes bacterium GWF2_51_9]OGS59339.1 MAG: hypothetical protein A2Y19_09080 [Firmicutes bacterium GWE2_51_13]HAM62377.1 hypothetical protein [Erysipelotrichaceae bacterium]HBZ40296.1 hypothetical protein [Erysipelotrichaceae bacterium]
MKKGLFLIIAIFVTEGISRTSSYITDQLSSILPYQSIDPYGLYLYISVHHLFQLFFAALAILFVFRLVCKNHASFMLQFGLKWPDQPSKAFRFVALFTVVWAVVQFGVGYYMVTHQMVDASIAYPLRGETLIGQYLFQLLLSGTSEELLYRSLLIGLSLVIFEKPKVIWIYAFTLVPFLVGHIPYQLYPFQIYQPNILQLVTVFTFGSFYTYLYLNFKSVIPPMIAHGVLNAVIITSGFLLSYL